MVGLLVVMFCTLALPAGVWSDPRKEARVSLTTIDVPFAGAHDTLVTGLTPQGRPVGAYVDARGNLHGFLRLRPDLFLPLLNVAPHDIALVAGVETVTGFYTAPGAVQPDTGIRGFVYADGTFQTLHVPRRGPGLPFNLITEAVALNEAGQVVGDFRSGEDRLFRGFLYDPATETYTTIAVPGAQSTALVGLNNQGTLIGTTLDAGGTRRIFRYDVAPATLTLLTIPDLPDVELAGITDSGLLAGNAGLVGFVYDGTTVQVIDVPDAILTELLGVREDAGVVTVWGRYADAAGENHGFIATTPFESARHAPQRVAKMHTPFGQEHCCAGSKRAVCRGR